MKTYQLILAAALVALASCNKIDVVDNNVNLDNEINIADINTAIDMVMAGEQNMIADINNDNEVNIADINALIDLILSGQ